MRNHRSLFKILNHKHHLERGREGRTEGRKEGRKDGGRERERERGRKEERQKEESLILNVICVS